MVDATQTAINLIIGFLGDSGSSGISAADFVSGLGVLNDQIDDIHRSISRQIDDSMDATINTGSNVHLALQRDIRDQTNVLVPVINSAVSTILGAMQSANGGISQADLNAVNNILFQILGNTNALIDINSSQVSQIITPLLQSNNSLGHDLFAVEQDINSGFAGVLSSINEVLGAVNNQGEIVIHNQVLIDESIYGSVISSIAGIIDSQNAHNLGVLDGITGSLNQIIQQLLGSIALDDIQDRDNLRRIADVLEMLSNPTLENIERMGRGGSGSFGNLFGEGFGEALAKGVGVENSILRDRALETIFGGSDQEDDDFCGLISWRSEWVDTDVPNLVFEVLIWVVTALILPLNASQVKANRAMQDYRKCFPDMLMQPGDLAGSWHRELITGEKAVDDLKKQGFTQEDAITLLNSSHLIPTIDMLLAAWLRGTIGEEDMHKGLKGLGYSDFHTRMLQELAFFIPPVQDLITMAVREVFSPEVARANGQFDDFPEQFAEWAAKQGVSREWAENYWAAHWRLPSEQMGFEMLHRGVIDEERLRGLLVALDIMPGWRDAIIEISYNPFTRVDIRRMHKLRVLSDDETLKAYKDIGYNPDNAAKLLDFTKALNEEEDLVTLDVASDLSRANILEFYRRGIIDRTVANLLMLQAGINAIAAELFLDNTDLKIELERRDDELALILTKYRVGDLTFEQANDAIIALQLEPLERQRASLELLKTKEVITKLPSRADLDKFILAGLVDADTYLETMERNGYSMEWAEKYLALTIMKLESDDEQATDQE